VYNWFSGQKYCQIPLITLKNFGSSIFFLKKSNVGVTHIALMSNYDQLHTYFPLKWLKLEVTEVDQHPCTGHAGRMLTFSGSAIIILFFSMSQI